MQILPIENYKLTDSGFVLKKSKAWAAKLLIVLAFLSYAAIPKPLESSYEPYTPIKVIQEQRIHEASKKIIQINPSVEIEEAQTIVEKAIKWGKKFGLEPALLLGVMYAESTFDRHAISHVGAFGLMQVLPRWHTEKFIKAREKLGNPEPFDIETNIYLGSWVLKDCISKYKNISTGLKCFNGSVGMDTNYHIKVLAGKQKFDNLI